MDRIQQFNIAERAKTVHGYRQTSLKICEITFHLSFNYQCLQNNLTPKYANIQIKHNTPAAKRTQHFAQKQYIKNNIKDLHLMKTIKQNKLYSLYHELTKAFHHYEIDQIITHTKIAILKLSQKLKNKHDKKINALKSTQIQKITTTHNFYPKTINTTNITFTDKETQLLDKGLKYIIPKKQHIDKLIIDIETSIQKTHTDHQDHLRHITIDKITKLNKQRTNKDEIYTLASIQSKQKTHNLHFTKADKGNTTVIISDHDLNKKVNDFITTNNIITLNTDPTSAYQKQIKHAINTCQHIFTSADKAYMKQINPKAPVLQALPKVHKPNIPIRPLVNHTSAPAHKVAKKLQQIIQQHITFHNHTSIKNTTELVNKIKDTHVPHNSTLSSFDITNLYTIVPINETIQLLHNMLIENNTPSTHIQEIITLTKLITSQNYFTHNHKFYKQPEGLPMGSPISGILAEIFIHNIEKTKILTPHNKHFQKIIYWHRYVDDIIILYHGTARQIHQLHTLINKAHPQLKFTIEVEQNNSLNFLDLQITKSNNKHEFNIYRKPTTTDTIIHNTSNHPTQHKHAALNTMIHRLLNIPMNKINYNNEVNIIKYIAQENGYDPKIVDNKINKFINRAPQTQNPSPNNKFITLTYHNQHTHTLARKFTTLGYKIGYKTHNKLSQTLNQKHTIDTNNNLDKHNSTGVYKITCNDCNNFYIGQTGRSFTTRFKEHINPLRNPTYTQTRYSEHIHNNNHTYTDIHHNLHILHTAPKGPKLNTLEQYEIYKHVQSHPDDILNDHTHFKSHALFDTLINNTYSNPNTFPPT